MVIGEESGGRILREKDVHNEGCPRPWEGASIRGGLGVANVNYFVRVCMASRGQRREKGCIVDLEKRWTALAKMGEINHYE